MNVGDIVKWARFDKDEEIYKVLGEPRDRWDDLGIILSIDVWDQLETEPETIVVEVYFFKVGIIWANPKSLDVVSSLSKK
tara:strand:+ start:430 stop:669 length:240 start_codon:yes stop_codon:yes gene_type:complete